MDHQPVNMFDTDIKFKNQFIQKYFKLAYFEMVAHGVKQTKNLISIAESFFKKKEFFLGYC